MSTVIRSKLWESGNRLHRYDERHPGRLVNQDCREDDRAFDPANEASSIEQSTDVGDARSSGGPLQDLFHQCAAQDNRNEQPDDKYAQFPNVERRTELEERPL